MARLSFFLSAVLGICLSLSLFCAQTAVAQSSGSIEVLYIVSDYTLFTFNVDRQTGMPTEEGQGVTLPAGNANLVPSGNGHFLYLTGYDSQLIERLWVYSTDLTGVPQFPAIQEFRLLNQSFYGFQIDANGKLAYAVSSKLNGKGENIAEIRLFRVDANTGMLTPSPTVVTFPPNGPCDPGATPTGLVLNGFSPDGSKLYDSWICDDHDSTSAYYYSVPVNRQTGSLGASTQTISWIDGSQGADYVNITPTAILYYSIPNNINQGINSLSVYPLSGGTQPLFTCTAAMLEACGYGLYDWVDPSGRYVFIQTANDSTEITKLELAAKKVVDTGNYIPGIILGFSPDDTLVYSENVDFEYPYFLPIYVFDPATGGVTNNGGQIELQSVFASVVPAVRR